VMFLEVPPVRLTLVRVPFVRIVVSLVLVAAALLVALASIVSLHSPHGVYWIAMVKPVWLWNPPICSSTGTAGPVAPAGTTALICVNPETSPGDPPL
jgi:hypothetical protein